MDETPNDSGESSSSPAWPATLRQQVRRPAVWGLVVVIIVVVLAQIWLLFL